MVGADSSNSSHQEQTLRICMFTGDFHTAHWMVIMVVAAVVVVVVDVIRVTVERVVAQK